ncbi:MAG: DUF2341 domain-containing protein, partial [Chthoniobacteraceae bacterium]
MPRKRSTQDNPTLIKKARRKLMLESFEDRILCSAAVPIEPVPEVPHAVPDTAATAGSLPADAAEPAPVPQAADAPAPVAGANAQPADARGEVVFVDRSVADWQAFLDDVTAQAGDGRSIDVILLDPARDGVTQITEALAGRSGVEAVHIIAHGIDGGLSLGNAWLTSGNIADFADSIAAWKAALSDNADLLLYGCDIAGGENGRALLGSLGALTGADVAASTDETGHSSLGADWELEYALGAIEARNPVTVSLQQGWLQVMAAHTVRDNFSVQGYTNNNGTRSWTGNWTEIDGGGGGATGGRILVTAGGVLQVNTRSNTDEIYRQVDLSTAATATLNFSYNNTLVAGRTVVVEVSGNGGGSYTILETFTSASNAGAGTKSINISSFIAANTRIRISVDASGGTDSFVTFDNIEVAYVTIPVRLDDVSNDLTEAAPNGTFAYDLQEYFTGNDTDSGGVALTYSITGGNTGGAFAINASTGVITVANSAALVWATTPAFNLTVQASDGSLTDTATVTINLAARPIDGSIGTFAVSQANRLYSVSLATGKATLLFTDTLLATINSLGFDAVNGIYYYTDGANAGTNNDLYGWDAKLNQRFVLTADVTAFGVVLPTGGLGAAGGGFGGGSYFFSTEGGGPASQDQLYNVNFLAGSNGRTIQNIQLVSNTAIPGGNEFGDFLVDPAAGKFWSFNSGTGVVEYNMRLGASPSLTVVQTDTNAVTMQSARDRNGQMYVVDGYFRTYNSAGAGTFGPQTTMTTNGVTALGSVTDAGEYLPATSSIGDRVWYDTTANGVQDVGEQGITGLTVSLYYDLNANGVRNAGDNLVATTLTGADGAYTFNQLLPDTYLIEITDPTSILNGATSTTGGNIQTAAVTLIGQAVTNKDFGYQDNRPTLAVSNVTATEGTDGFAQFNVTLSRTFSQPITVSLALANGTATGGGTDYGTGGAGNLQVFNGASWVDAASATFSVGATSILVRTPVVNDTLDENNETFTLTATRTAGVTTNASAVGTGTIVDNDPAPVVTIADASAVEGSPLVFDVTLSNGSGGAIVLNMAAAAPGTGTAGTDYETTNFEYSTDGGTSWLPAAGGTQVTIPAGSTAIKVRVDSTGDTLDETNETFTLSVAGVVSGTVGSTADAGLGTVNDNDPSPNITVDDVTRNEAAGTMTFTVSLNTASGLPVSVNYATSDGTATAGNDYTSASGTLNFAAGETSKTVVVTILNDAVFENSEAFNLNLSGAVNGTITDALGVGTILDNGGGSGGTDNDTPTLAVSNASAIEGTDNHAVFTVSLSNPSSIPVSFNLALANVTATGGGTDYGTGGVGNLQVSTDGGLNWADATSATIPALGTSVLVRTPITADLIAEAAETFTLTATRTAGTTTNASASGTGAIVNNQPPVAVNNAYTTNEDTTLTVGWWDTAWTRRQQITFSGNTFVGAENLTNYPVLIKLNSGNIDYAQTQNNGADLRFFDSDGTLLAYEIEKWNESGDSYVWVKVPQISTSGTDSITMYYGNAAASAGQNPGATWAGTGYSAVYHLGETIGTTIADSTANGFNGTLINGGLPGAGQVGGSKSFDGVNDYVTLGTNRAFINNTSQVTLSAWVNPTTVTGTLDLIAVSVNNGGAPTSSSRAGISIVNGQIQVFGRSPDAQATARTEITVATVPAGSWSLVEGVIDYATNTIRVYINGVLQASTSGGPALTP